MRTPSEQMMEREGLKPNVVRAVVQVTVEVAVGGWGPDHTIGQAVAQASEDAAQQVRQALESKPSVLSVSSRIVRVICEAEKRK